MLFRSFSDDDLSLIDSISGRLVSALEIEKEASKTQEYLETLSSINNKINSSSDKDEILKDIIKSLTDEDALGYEFAAIQLINEEKELIETVEFATNQIIHDKVDSGIWNEQKSFSLKQESGKKLNIHSYVLNVVKEAIVVKGKDSKYYKYLDKRIFDKYDQGNLIRAFVPIIDNNPKGGKAIGTIEAGYKIKRKEIIEKQELEMLSAVANQVAITITNWEQKEILKRIKDEAFFKSLSSMANAISHKMNNYVGLIKQKSTDVGEMIQDNCFAPKEYFEIVSIINKKCEEALKLPQYLSDLLSRIDSVSKSEINLDELIASDIIPHSKELANEILGKNKVTIEYKRNPGLPTVHADKILITEAFNELMQNSIKSMKPDGGTITIKSKKSDGNILIYFIDVGNGIPKKSFDEIFSPGFSLSGSGGHGLWMCKNIVKIIHEGEIFVQDSSKLGTTFCVKLPC